MLFGYLVEIHEHYQKLILHFVIYLKTETMLLFSRFWSDIAG